MRSQGFGGTDHSEILDALRALERDGIHAAGVRHLLHDEYRSKGGPSCTEAALDSALAGGGSVTFNCGSDPVSITVTHEKTIATSTSIDGGGLITLSGGGTTRLFSVKTRASTTLTNLTLRDGNATRLSLQWGGAIDNRGRLTISNSTFSNNRVGGNGEGGMINNFGRLTLTNDLFENNSATRGGVILNWRGKVTATNCKFDNNTSEGQGGVIYSEVGKVSVTNSTFSNNSGGSGGAIFNYATLNVTNCTFSNNSASGAGGAITSVAQSCSGCLLRHAKPILINNILAGTAEPNCEGALLDGGHNLDSGSSCGLKASKGSLSNTDPVLDLAGLADNGRPTQTIALEAGSPAINAGKQSVCRSKPVKNLDQRGFVRPGSGSLKCAIGAYEYNSPGPRP